MTANSRLIRQTYAITIKTSIDHYAVRSFTIRPSNFTKCDSPERIRIDVAVQPCAEYYVTVAVK